MDKQHSNAESPTDDLGPTALRTMWDAERHAMTDAAAAMDRLAVSLPEASDLQRDMLGAASGWAECAALRGMNSPIEADVARELPAARRRDAERVLAGGRR